MQLVRRWFTLWLVFALLNTGPYAVFAKERSLKKRKTQQTRQIKKSPTSSKVQKKSRRVVRQRKSLSTASRIYQQLNQAKRKWRQGQITQRQFWNQLNSWAQSKRTPDDVKSTILQIQAQILQNNRYPILASLYASNALSKTRNPLSTHMNTAWYILRTASSIDAVVKIIEQTTELTNSSRTPPAFGRNFYYYKGNNLQDKQMYLNAIKEYKKLKPGDDQYLAAQYQLSVLNLDKKNYSEAIDSLKTILNTPIEQNDNEQQQEKTQTLRDLAKLTAARLFYEQKKFTPAIKFYRAISRDSDLFYDALFEQSWAFFMGGHPNHALGALHGVESPFFKNVYNPEAPLLRALIYYWMCRYEDSRAALADFTARYGDTVESLGNYLKRRRLSDDDAFELFENLISGVSEKSLGIDRSLLETAATAHPVMLSRGQYAAVYQELQDLKSRGLLQLSYRQQQVLEEALKRYMVALRKDIGSRFLAELKNIRQDFERLYEQSQFLYVELLMSEKEQLLGRELHAATKIDRVSKRKNIDGWGSKYQQAWKDNGLNEYWVDEVGYYIYDIRPQCQK